MALVEVSIIPLGTGTTSVSKYVAKAVEVLKGEEDIRYELTAMGTVLEGDLDQLLALVRRMHEALFDIGAMRVVTTMRIDDRRDKPSAMKSKIESLRRALGH